MGMGMGMGMGGPGDGSMGAGMADGAMVNPVTRLVLNLVPSLLPPPVPAHLAVGIGFDCHLPDAWRAPAQFAGPAAIDGIPPLGPVHLSALQLFAFAYGFIVGTWGLVVMPAESLRMFPHRHILIYGGYISLLAIMQLSSPFLTLWIGRSRYLRRRKL